MSITVFGMALIPLGLVLAFGRPAGLFYLAVFFVPFSATSVINLDTVGFGLRPPMFLVCLLLGSIMLFGWRRFRLALTDDQWSPAMALLVFYLGVLFSLWGMALRGVLGQFPITQAAYLTFGVLFTLLVPMVVHDAATYRQTLRLFVWSTLFVSLWGFMQVAVHAAGIPYPAELFNNSASKAALEYQQVLEDFGVKRVSSVAVEPSILVQSLLYFIALGGTLWAHRVRLFGALDRITLIAAALCTLLATSTTGYAGLGLVAALIGRERLSAGLKLAAMLAVAGTIALIAYPPLLQALASVTVDKAESWSYQDRVGSMRNAFIAFLSSPVFGTGWASNQVYSLPMSLLGNLGLVGFALYCGMMVTVIVAAWRVQLRLKRQCALIADLAVRHDLEAYRAIIRGLINALLVSLACQSIAGFTYVFLDFWFVFGLLLATFRVGMQTADAAAAVPPPEPDPEPAAVPGPEPAPAGARP